MFKINNKFKKTLTSVFIPLFLVASIDSVVDLLKHKTEPHQVVALIMTYCSVAVTLSLLKYYFKE